MASRSSVHHPDTTEGFVQTLDPCTGRRGCLDTMETMKMSYELLKTITDNFSEDNILGSGTFGVVYKGVLNGKEIAVKILRDMAALDDNAFRNEFQNLARLDHRNIVQLVGYCNESEKQTVERDDGTEVIAEKMHVALCFQYIKNGSLHKHISDEYQGLHWHIRYKIIKGICEGLEHLRVGLESPVLHLDLKPENILLDKEMVPKIADFGLSRLIGDERTKQTINSVGTCGYWPPEYVKFQLLSEAFDIFSLGVIITKIMIGNEGYHSFADMLPRKLVKHVHNNWKKRLQKTVKLTSLELEAYCQQVKTCIVVASKCLSENRYERPGIQQIVVALNETEIMIRNIPLQIQKKVNPTYVMEKYSMELLRRMTDDFSEGRLLGKGGFGSVYKGIHEDGREIAVKVLRYFSAFRPEQFQAEVETVARFRHENIIQLAGYCYEIENSVVELEGKLIFAERIHSAICFEYLQNGSLERHILEESDELDWCTRYKIIRGTCNGLQYLHEGLSYPIKHFDLKPSNILLDGNMVPKIADFALERLFGEEDAMRTIRGFSTMRYLPPEFVTMQIISKEFDIYSLGIIILEMMAGISAHTLLHDMVSEEFIKFVLSKWRKRLEATLKGRRLLVETYCQQVKICIEIALNCVEADRNKRPNIGDVISVLDKTEKTIHDAESEWNDEDSRSSYTKNSLNCRHMIKKYSYKLLREITNDFSEDRLLGLGAFGRFYKGVNEDGREIAVKEVFDFIDISGFNFQNELDNVGMTQHENIVQLVGYCDETEKLFIEHHGKVVIAEKIHRALCFEYLQNGSLANHISGEYDGLDWCRRYKILKGICDGLRYLHEELPSPIFHLDLKPSHILLDENMVPKISGFTLSRCLQEGHTVVTSSRDGTIGYMPPEFINKGIISAKFDIYSLGVTIIYMLTGRRGYTTEDIISQEFMEDVLKNWRRRLQESLKGRSLEGYCQQVKKCIEIASQCVVGDRHKRPNIGAIVRMLDETETMIMVHDAGKLLDVQPMELRFPLKPKRYASSLLRLRNKEDDRVAFRLVSRGQKVYHRNLPLLGIVPPRCTYNIALTMSNQQKQPRLDGDEGLLLQSVAVSRHQCLDQASVLREFQSLFKKAQELDDDEVQEVTLKFVSSPPAEEASSKATAFVCQLTRPEIEIITAPDAQEVSSIEVHPKEPWIMTTHERGNLRIWNYQTLAIMNPIKLPEESVYVAKFIAREEWIVAGDGNGCIHVFSYDEYQDTTSFEAHNGQIMSLAVHPKNSCVLSSSHEDHLIKLWHWDKYWDLEKGPWVCTRTFEGHSNKVSHVIFNPDGTDSFTSASWDGTVKIWGSLNSDVCNTITLDKHPDGLLCVDYITGADPQHLITGSKDQTAQIWDLEIKRCREYLQGHAHHVSVVYCHQELQKLFTGSLDGTVRIWDSTTYRLENIIALNLGAVSDVGYIDELQRIVVGCHKGIAMMEIKFR